ncbi:MAG: hypothetical protein QM736_15575 [Vicinamibacterales bacterium]
MPILRRAALTLFIAVAGNVAFVQPAKADVVLLLGQPWTGRFGAFSPTGHASVYLSGVCAESPIAVRLCAPGEHGVVISRYHRVAGRDWLAIPLIPYLYAVDDVTTVPVEAGASTVLSMRDAYRRLHLTEFVPDDPGRAVPKGDWVQLIGAAYDRGDRGAWVDDHRIAGS